jgi:pyruvate/2-oxoglutarate dehydrogenase complex dihydrolipoamide dehydrogenase (E3) component
MRLVGAVPTDEGLELRLLDLAARTELTRPATALALATGRRPASRELGLETVTVEQDRAGHIHVDSHLETATPGLYAVGGLVPSPRTIALACREGRQAVDHAAGQPAPPIRYLDVVHTLRSVPEAAWAGLTADAARAAGYRIALGEVTDPVYVRVVADAEAGVLLGAQLHGDRASDHGARLAASLRQPLDTVLADLERAGSPAVAAVAAARVGLGS